MTNESARVRTAKLRGERSTPRTILANSLVDERIELDPGQGDFVGVVLPGVAGFGKFSTAPRRRGDMVTSPRGHQLGDFASGEELRLTSQTRRQHNFSEMLESFHAKKSGEEVGAASDGAMIGEKQRIIVRHVGFEHCA